MVNLIPTLDSNACPFNVMETYCVELKVNIKALLNYGQLLTLTFRSDRSSIIGFSRSS